VSVAASSTPKEDTVKHLRSPLASLVGALSLLVAPSLARAWCDERATCADAIVSGDGENLCEDSDAAIYFELFETCVCKPDGACGKPCGSYCDGGIFVGPFPVSADCEVCYQDTETGCGRALSACMNEEP